MSVYYRFKSSVNCDKVTFDGLHISVGELKKQILQQKKIGKSNDFDLQISNAETKEVYTSDDMLIQKNTTVIVARVPVNSNKKQWKDAEQILSINKHEAYISLDKIIKSSDLTNLDETEEEKLKTIMTQSTQDYDSSKFIKTRSMVGPVPSNYICHRCGKGGHFIKHCPTNQTDNVKRSTGIPRSFMMPAKADQKGALLTATGEYVVPIIDHQAYKEPKKEKPPFVPTENPEFDENLAEKIPEELQCLLCKSLMHDSVMIPCCSNSYCDDCIRTHLLESEQHQCPTCSSTGISPDTLLPNRYLRKKVDKFKNENFNPVNKALEDVKNSEEVESNESALDSTPPKISESQSSPKLKTEENDKPVENELMIKEINDIKASDLNENNSNEAKLDDKSKLDEQSNNQISNNEIKNSLNNEKLAENSKSVASPEINSNKDDTKLKDNKESSNHQLNEESNKRLESNFKTLKVNLNKTEYSISELLINKLIVKLNMYVIKRTLPIFDQIF